MPRDDMLTALVEAEVTDDDGTTRRLTQTEATAFANLLVSAGTETVARLLGNVGVVLAAHPDQRADLAADATLLPNAVEELLRYEAPSPVQGRWTTRDVELHGEIDPGRLEGPSPHRFGRPRRAEVSRPRSLRHPSPDRPSRLVRLRDPLLHRGCARAASKVGSASRKRSARYPEWEVDHENARRLHTSTVRGWLEVPVLV